MKAKLRKEIEGYCRKNNVEFKISSLKDHLSRASNEERRHITSRYGMYLMRKNMYPHLFGSNYSEKYNYDARTQPEYDTIINGWKVEEKCEYKDYDNLAIEIIQGYPRNINMLPLGWIMETKADIVTYCFPFSKKDRYYLINNDILLHFKSIGERLLKMDKKGIALPKRIGIYTVYDGRGNTNGYSRSLLLLVPKSIFKYKLGGQK